MFQLKFSPEPLKNSLITRLTTSTNGFRTGPQIDFQILQKKKQKNKAKTQTPGEKRCEPICTSDVAKKGQSRPLSKGRPKLISMNFTPTKMEITLGKLHLCRLILAPS